MRARKNAEDSRGNQRRRTRKDLLEAAARLLKAGGTPDMDAVAEAAMVSRATAYRYFPTIEALLVEAPLDGEVPEADDVFAGDTSVDPAARVEKAEAMLHEVCCRNEAQLRVMLAASLGRAGAGVPVRQNRRMGLIEGALAPAKGRFTPRTYADLCAALSLVFGTEAMVVFSDVLGMDAKEARRVKRWAVRALVEAALEEGASGRRGASPK